MMGKKKKTPQKKARMERYVEDLSHSKECIEGRLLDRNHVFT